MYRLWFVEIPENSCDPGKYITVFDISHHLGGEDFTFMAHQLYAESMGWV